MRLTKSIGQIVIYFGNSFNINNDLIIFIVSKLLIWVGS